MVANKLYLAVCIMTLISAAFYNYSAKIFYRYKGRHLKSKTASNYCKLTKTKTS
jgi:hypothetical protein